MGFVEKVNIVAEFIDNANNDLHVLVDEATAQAGSASDSATTATEQATIATTQAGIATTQAGIATTKATSATASATSATASAQSASDSATLATTKANSATASATSATTSATTATTQAGIATTKASEASASATSASTSEANALSYKTSAYNYSVNSANSATSSAGSATLAQGYASAASNSANSASSSATSAGTSATNANSSAGVATTQASIATTKAGEASTSATNAATSESNALSYKNSASTSATTATTQAGIATTQADIATTKAGEASASATSASGYATSASTSAANAHNSELAAAQSATTAANTVAPFTSHLSNTSNPHSVTKAQVGLGNVDNTSDATKNSAVATLTNKTIDDITNVIGSNHVHYKVKATQAISAGNLVKVTGYNQGEDAVEIALVSSSSDAAMGIAESAIANGSFGLITVTGVISNINTSSFTVGSILYSNGSGGLTATKPTSGTYQACAVALRSNLNNGSLLVAFAEPRNVNWDSSYYTKAQTDSNISTAIANLVNSAPASLDTLNELAAALGNDANFATTVTNSLANKVDKTTTVNGHALSGNVTVTKGDVGLSNVDNTSDLNKPISTATQTALDLKANQSTTYTKTETDTALGLKAPLASPTFTGTVSGITKAMVGLGSVDNTSDSAKNVLSATKLTTARTINGVSFDGTANITVTATDSSKQPLDADLTAIAGLAGTSGILKKTAADTWTLDTSTYITGNQSISISGDASGSGTTSIALTLANSGVTAATYGSSTNIPQIAVDAKGRITSASNVAVSIPSGSISVTGGDFTMSGSTGTAITNATLANSGVTAGTYTKTTVDAKGRVTSGTTLSSSDLPTYTGTITSSQITTGLGFTPYNSTNPSGYTNNTGTVTSVVGGSYLTGGTITTSGTLAVDATSANTASKVVARDSSGNFSAGTITASLSGNATTATTASNSNALGGLGVSAFMRDDGWNNSPGQDANTQEGMRSDFSYSNNAPHTGDLIRFGSGGYSLQLSSEYGSGQGFSFRTRNGDAGSWNPWRQLLHAGNYTSYSPSLTGSGASGTWGISVSGNAATATQTITTSAAAGTPCVANGTTNNTKASYVQNWSASGYGGIRFNAGQVETITCSDLTGTYSAMAPIVGSNITAAGNVTGSSTSCTGNAATATTATNVAWSGVTSKPTTLSGYGITDAASLYASGAVYENTQTISSNYTMTSGKSGMSAGDITIASGVTVTIPSGSRWVII